MSHPLDKLKDLPGPSAWYYRWLLQSVLIECRSTLWCARQLGADAKLVTRDLGRAIRGEVPGERPIGGPHQFEEGNR